MQSAKVGQKSQQSWLRFLLRALTFILLFFAMEWVHGFWNRFAVGIAIFAIGMVTSNRFNQNK